MKFVVDSIVVGRNLRDLKECKIIYIEYIWKATHSQIEFVQNFQENLNLFLLVRLNGNSYDGNEYISDQFKLSALPQNHRKLKHFERPKIAKRNHAEMQAHNHATIQKST